MRSPHHLLSLLTLLTLTLADDVGIRPGGPGRSLSGWVSLPNVAGAVYDDSSLLVRQTKARAKEAAAAPNATLAHYITDGYEAKLIKRAVVVIGEDRDSWNQWLYADLALKRATQGGGVKREEVVIMAPQFHTAIDCGAYGAYSPALQPPNSTTLVWDYGGTVSWDDGFPAIYPTDTPVGAFDALDSVLAFFLDRQRFPALVTVVLAGFSSGAQLVQRHAVFSELATDDDESRTHRWVASPGSFLYLDNIRPQQVRASCTGINDYKFGLEGELPPYVARNSGPLVKEILAERMILRKVNYAVGLRDRIAGDPRCQADSQGVDHISKLTHWVEQILPNLPNANGALPANSTVDYINGVAHTDWRMIGSDAGVQRLFLDEYETRNTAAPAPPSNGDDSGTPTDAHAASSKKDDEADE